MKGKFARGILSIGIAIVFLATGGTASVEEKRWYCKHTNDGSVPGLEGEFSFIRDYDCFYLDEDASSDDKVLYLTFDAGYENGNVEKILDALEAHEAQGAFFILENLIRRNPDLVKRMTQEGHLVCNHTATHANMAKITDEAEFCEELTRLEKAYTEITGQELARFYRPPEGTFNEENLKITQKIGYTTVLWSFAYADWDNGKQPDIEKAIDLILNNTHNGMIILLHPTSGTNATIMDTLLTRWEEMGYRFGSLEELTKAR